MSQDRLQIADRLLSNSKAAMIAAIEIHNKPIFPYRYEVCVLLIINAWELLLKSYISKYLTNINLFMSDGKTKPFTECLVCVSSNLGRDFEINKESIEILYEYRNNVAHYYYEDIHLIIFSVLKPNILSYSKFLTRYFDTDLSKEADLALMPISFKKPFSPVDFLTNQSIIQNAPIEIKNFINSIIESSKRLASLDIEDSILVDYRMNLTNENRIKNAHVIAGISSKMDIESAINIENILSEFTISNNPNAKEVRINDSDIKKIYPYKFGDVVSIARKIFSNFKQNDSFNRKMKKIKDDAKTHHVRLLDPDNPKSSRQDRYNQNVFKELAKFYTLKEGIDLENLETISK